MVASVSALFDGVAGAMIEIPARSPDERLVFVCPRSIESRVRQLTSNGVTVPDELTLRRTAGATWARAEDLFRRGRVLVMHTTAEGVAGKVLGTRMYQTEVRIGVHGLSIVCTCPMERFCKHGFAMAIRWTRDVANRVEIPSGPSASRPEPPAASSPAPQVAGFESRDEIVAWARQHHVTHALRLSAFEAAPYLSTHLRYQLSYQLHGLKIGDLACAVELRQRVRPVHVADEVAAAARLRLETEARDVSAGLAEEVDRSRVAPSPEVAALWDRVIALRQGQRDAGAVPRSRARRAGGAWSFSSQKLQIAWHDPDHRLGYGAATTLAFVNDRPALVCPCGEEVACTHRVALVDATLDVLADPSRRDVASQASSELTRPGWSRVIAALARVDAIAKPDAQIEVWWQIESTAYRPAVVPVIRKITKRGTLSTGARATVDKLLAEYGEVLEPADRTVAELLISFGGGVRTTSYPHRAIAALIGHPRVRCTRGDAAVAVRRTMLEFQARREHEAIRIEPVIDGKPFGPGAFEALVTAFEPTDPLLHIDEDGSCTLIDVSRAARALWTQLAAHGDTFPPEAHEPLLEVITKLDATLVVAVPEELKGTAFPEEPTVVARVRLVQQPQSGGNGEVSLELEAMIRPAPGAPLFAPGDGRRDVMIVRDGQRGYVRRRLSDELALQRSLLARLPLADAEEGPPHCFRVDSLEAALEVVKALEHPPSGLEAQWVDERPRLVSRVGAKAVRLEIKRHHDWFGIDGDVKVEQGRLELAVLLDAMRHQQRYVRVGVASWVELTDELRARLQPIADHAFATRGRIELSIGAMPAMTALIEDGAKVTAEPAWTLIAKRLAAAGELAPRPPVALRKILRPYQVEGHAWLTRVAAWGGGACLADDMGLGKTVQAIAVLIDRASLGPAIVLAPTSVTPNWVNELTRFAPKLRPVLLTEASDRDASLAKLGKGDVLIVSYGLLTREIAKLAGLRFATLVADEAQALKNAATQRAKAARQLDAEFRIAMTGTPLENHLGELWSMFAVVFPGLLGSWDQFRDRYATPIERGAEGVDAAAVLGATRARGALARVLRPFLLRRTKAEVATELPSRTEIEVAIEMSRDERELYDDARLAAVAHLTQQGKDVRDEQRRFQVLAALTRLRLLASHPKLYDGTSHVPSSKLARLVELVDELRAGGHRALVFSQFTKHLALVRDELARTGVPMLYLDGETSIRERARRIDAFQAGEADLFLISLKAGGTGINLTAADYVIHLDPWWNPAVEDQATDRAHRIGQTKPVTVYRLITKGTVEDKILAMHGKKRELVSQVLEGTGAAASVKTTELLALLANA